MKKNQAPTLKVTHPEMCLAESKNKSVFKQVAVLDFNYAFKFFQRVMRRLNNCCRIRSELANILILVSAKINFGRKISIKRDNMLIY